MMATRSGALSTSDHDPLLSTENSEDKKIKAILVSLVFLVIIMAVIIIILSVQGANNEWPFKSNDAQRKETTNYKRMYEFQWAPFTPTNNDYSTQFVPTINYNAIQYLAETGHKFGANMIFLGGSNAQFDTMSVDERKELLSTWINQTILNNYNFKIIFDVSSTRIFESIELAQYAAELNSLYGLPQAIASLPPFWERPSTQDDFEQLMKWFRPIVDAAPGIEFWFHDLPQETNVILNINDFVNVAFNGNEYGTSLKELKGTKYVESTNPIDVFKTTNDYDGFHFVLWSQPQMGWTSYTKAAGFGANYYSIPITKCILKAIENNKYDDVYDLQKWNNDMNALIGDNVQQRCLHQTISGFDMGPPRQPDIPINQSVCDSLLHQLEQLNYFDIIQQQIQDCV